MSAIAATLRESVLERRFRFAEHGTTLGRDTMAGTTTFMVMCYIIPVNAVILSFTGVPGLEGKGLPFAAVVSSTCLVAGVMSVLMGFFTNKAYAIAPGMGLNAFVAFTIVAGGGLTFDQAMGLVMLEGGLIVVLAVTGLREQIVNAIPLELKKAIAIGIGLFIAFIGLYGAGIVVPGNGTPVALGHLTTWPIFVAVFGFFATLWMRSRGWRASLILGIAASTVLAVVINSLTHHKAFGAHTAAWPGWHWHSVVQNPDFSRLGHVSLSSFSSTSVGWAVSVGFLVSLFMSDFFDFAGTSIGVGKPAGYVEKDGTIKGFWKMLLIDGLAAIFGGAANSSSATAFIESGSGVEAGGRTGWVACVAGLLFFPFLFFSPLIELVPAQATMAALLVVGYLMMTVLTEAEDEAEEGGKFGVAGRVRSKLSGIDFHDEAIGFAAAVTMLAMPATYSITNGIGFGFLTYVAVCAFKKEWHRIKPLMWLSTIAMAAYFLVPLLQDHGVL